MILALARSYLGVSFYPAIIGGGLLTAGALYASHLVLVSCAEIRGYENGTVDTHRAYAEAERKRELERLAKRTETEKVLGEREATRSANDRQQAAKEAQERINTAQGTAKEREAFFKQEAQRNLDEVKSLQKLIIGLEGKEPEAKVIKEYVTKYRTRKFSGDGKPSSSFLQHYKRLNTEASQIEQRAFPSTGD